MLDIVLLWDCDEGNVVFVTADDFDCFLIWFCVKGVKTGGGGPVDFAIMVCDCACFDGLYGMHIEPTLKKSDLLSDNFKVAISPAIVSFFEKKNRVSDNFLCSVQISTLKIDLEEKLKICWSQLWKLITEKVGSG